ncbi:MAG TPA: ABC transporter permease, partial [Terriglobales bacterium]
MNISEAMRIALQSLWANKLRSVLTLLGVVIGVSSVIAVVTFVNGINGYVAERVFRYGADVFNVNKTPRVSFKVEDYLEALKRKDIEMADYQAVREECSACKMVAATLANQNGKIKFGQESTSDTEVRGWTDTMAPIYDLDLIMGRSITDYDVRAAARAVVIGHDIYENLVGSVDPIGKEIRVDGDTYLVIGVGKKEGSTFGRSRDNWVMMPITTYQAKYGTHNSVQIWGKAYGVGNELSDALDQTRVILRTRRHDTPAKPDSFELATNDTFLSIWTSISQNFFLVTIAIASISLIVGGIVIMNIMLV